MKKIPQQAAVLTIGDELLNGTVIDTTTAWIGEKLSALGIQTGEAVTVGDAEQVIGDAVTRLHTNYPVVIVCGGLGPTEDDLTARSAAKALRNQLVVNGTALQQIRDYFHKTRRKMPPANEKQALIPAKARVLQNHQGTAPGFVITDTHGSIYFLPGVPLEMRAMFSEQIQPELQNHFATSACRERVLHFFGMAEPEVEKQINRLTLPEDVSIAFGLDSPVVLVRLRCKTAGGQSRLDQAEEIISKALGAWIVGCDDQTLPQRLVERMARAGKTLSLAESCTGGLIAALITEVPGSSAVLERSGVTYANSAKQHWLQVSEQLLNDQGAVSAACASAMARGIRDAAHTDLAAAVTGIAGPGGGTEDKPVGTVYIAYADARGVQVQRSLFHGSRRKIRLQTAFTVLQGLLKRLEETRHV